jgi:hypothetical protein
MLRHRYIKIAEPMSEQTYRKWIAGVLGWIWDALVIIIIALLVGGFYLYERSRLADERNQKTQDFSRATACLILSNPKVPPKYREYINTIRRDYPDCPNDKHIGEPSATPSPTPKPHPTVEAVLPPPATVVPGPTVTTTAPGGSGGGHHKHHHRQPGGGGTSKSPSPHPSSSSPVIICVPVAVPTTGLPISTPTLPVLCVRSLS